MEYLDERYPEIKQLCEMFNARAYIHVSKLNHKDISLLMMERLAQRIRNGVVNQKGLFDSVAGELKGSEKRWIVDVDTMIDSMPAATFDTAIFPKVRSMSKAKKVAPLPQPAPQVIYVEDKDDNGGGILGVSNELITLLIGVGNIVLLVFEVKKKSTP